MERIDLAAGVSWLLAVTGWLATIGFGLHSVRLQRKLRTFDIREVIAGCRRLSNDMKRANFDPDLIIVPGEKNALIAHFISEFSAIRPSVVVATQVYHGDELPAALDGATKLESSRSTLIFPCSMTGIEERKILFVDSIKKSGATLQSVRTFLRTRGVPEENFRSLCLVNSANYEDSIMPSFYYKRMEGEVIFPWQTVHVT